MNSPAEPPPVHDSLDVLDVISISKNEDWWKAVVKYRYEGSSTGSEVAIYLWHDEEGWTRKHKYVIKTREGWEEDKAVIERFLATDEPDIQEDLIHEYPASDYYELRDAETVFKSDGWWKAVLRIGRKDEYDTDEVMIYLW